MIEVSNIPTTGRKPAFQVKQMGFKSLDDFTNSLPKNASVADIGAGYSRLGEEVASTRNDITWINIDPCYSDIKMKVSSKVKFINADIVLPNNKLKMMKGKIDVVYSYWLMPHLSLENSVAANNALVNMKELLSDKGVLIVGPIKKLGLGIFSFIRYKETLRYKKSQLSPQVIEFIVFQTKLWWLPRKVQLIANRYNIHIAKLFVGGRIRQ